MDSAGMNGAAVSASNIVYAIHDFIPENEDEVSFRAGEPIVVIERDDQFGDGWWNGRNLRGESGLFPANFVSPVPINAATVGQQPELINSAAATQQQQQPQPQPQQQMSAAVIVNEAANVERSFVGGNNVIHHQQQHSGTLRQVGSIEQLANRLVDVNISAPAPAPAHTQPLYQQQQQQQQQAQQAPYASQQPSIQQAPQYAVQNQAQAQPSYQQQQQQQQPPQQHYQPQQAQKPYAPSVADSLNTNRPEMWTIDQVAQWLHNSGFGSLAPKFIENEITGDILMELNLSTLKELDIAAFGKRFKLMEAINSLKEQASRATATTTTAQATPAVQPTVPTAQSQPQSQSAPQQFASQYQQQQQQQQHQAPAPQQSQSPSHHIPAKSAVRLSLIMSPQQNTQQQLHQVTSPNGYGGLPSHFEENEEDSILNMEKAMQASLQMSSHQQQQLQLQQQLQELPPAPASVYNQPSTFKAGQKPPPQQQPPVQKPLDAPQTTAERSYTPATPASAHAQQAPASPAVQESPAIHDAHQHLPHSQQSPQQLPQEGELDEATIQRMIEEKKARIFNQVKRSEPQPLPSLMGDGTQQQSPPPPLNMSPPQQPVQQQQQQHQPYTPVPVSTPGPTPSAAPVQQLNGGAPMFMNAPVQYDSPVGKQDDPNYTAPPFSYDTEDQSGYYTQLHQGWLQKKSESYKIWQSRFCVLQGPTMFLFKSDKDSTPTGTIDLNGYRFLNDPQARPGKFAFKLDHESKRKYYFSHDNHEVVRDWIKWLIKATIGRDPKAPVASSSNINTVPLHVAQGMQPRPPSIIFDPETGSRGPMTGANNAGESEGTPLSSSVATSTPHSGPVSNAGSPYHYPSQSTAAPSVVSALREQSQTEPHPSPLGLGPTGVSPYGPLGGGPPPPKPPVGGGFHQQFNQYNQFGGPSAAAAMSLPQYVKWLNHVFSNSPRRVRVNDLPNEIRDGTVLVYFLEELTGQKIPLDDHNAGDSAANGSTPLPSNSNGGMFATIQRAFDYMRSIGVQIPISVIPEDIALGLEDKITALLAAVRNRFPNSVPTEVVATDVI